MPRGSNRLPQLAILPLVALVISVEIAEACNVFSCPSSKCYWAGVANAICYDKDEGGERCKSKINGNQYNNWCWSNVCRTEKCCDRGASSGCSACSGSGTCTSCYSGYYHQSNNCHLLKNDGVTCSSSSHCKNKNCKTRCCKSGTASDCTSCTSSGNCASCSSSLKYPSGTSCLNKKNPGLSCSASVQCLSGSCRASRCCQSGISSRCQACNSAGYCSSCSSGYYPSGTSCLSKKSDGSTCAATNQCTSNICRGGHCCPTSISSSCSACTSSRTCSACSSSTLYPSGTSCLQKRDDGATCSSTQPCLSGDSNCKGGRCCPFGVSTLCTACTATDTCSACSDATTYPEGLTCRPKLTDGTTCSSSVRCLSGACRTRCCQSGIASSCASCSSSGSCSSCTSSSDYPSGLTCLPKKSPGGSCTSNQQCTTNRCSGGFCCVGSLPSNCNACATSSGSCAGCNDGYYLDTNLCVPRKTPGTSCSAAQQCISSKCIAGICCGEHTHSACTKCDGSGHCIACPTVGYELRGNSCVTPTATETVGLSPSFTVSELTTASTTISGTAETSSSWSAPLSESLSWSETGERSISVSATQTASVPGTLTESQVASPTVTASPTASASKEIDDSTATLTILNTTETPRVVPKTETHHVPNDNVISRSVSAVPPVPSTLPVSPAPTATGMTPQQSPTQQPSGATPDPTTATTGAVTVPTDSSIDPTGSAIAPTSVPPGTPTSASQAPSDSTPAPTTSVGPSDVLTTPPGPSPSVQQTTSEVPTAVFPPTSTQTGNATTPSPGATTSTLPVSTAPATTREPIVPLTPAPTLTPGQQCEALPQGPSPAKRFVVEESSARSSRLQLTWNTTDAIVGASLWDNAPSAIIAHEAFSVTFRRPGNGDAPSGGGFVAYVDGSGTLTTNASLELALPSELQLSIGPFPGYTIFSAAETLEIWLTYAWFVNGSRFCRSSTAETLSSPAVLVGELVVNPSSDTLLKDTGLVNEVVGDTALVASMMSSGGAAAAGDVTSVAILSTMACASPAQRKSGGNSWLISPIPFDPSTEGMLKGNLVLASSVAALHAFATVLLVWKRGIWSAPLPAMATMRFPSVFLACAFLLHQGTAYLSLRLVLYGEASSTTSSSVVCAFSFFFVLVFPFLAMGVSMRKIDAVFAEYVHSAVTKERPQGPLPSIVQRLLPRGRWEPRDMRRAYGIMLSPYAKKNPLWFLFPFMSPCIIAVASSPTPSTKNGCVVQYFAIAALQLVYVAVLVATRPYRSTFANAAAAISGLSVATVAVTAGLAMGNPENPTIVQVGAWAILVQAGITVIRVLYSIGTAIGERRITKGVSMRPILRRCPQSHPCDRTEEGSRVPLNNRNFLQAMDKLDEDDIMADTQHVNNDDEVELAEYQAPLLVPVKQVVEDGMRTSTMDSWRTLEAPPALQIPTANAGREEENSGSGAADEDDESNPVHTYDASLVRLMADESLINESDVEEILSVSASSSRNSSFANRQQQQRSESKSSRSGSVVSSHEAEADVDNDLLINADGLEYL